MWLSRLAGLVILAAGGGLLGFLWLQAADRSGNYLFVHRIGPPGVLLLAAAGMIGFVFGVHLLIAPRSAVKRWTPRLQRKA